MGHYEGDVYVYTAMDVGFGVCDEETYTRQRQKKRKEVDQNDGVDEELSHEVTDQ
jgi:hypothetical protein